MAGKNQLVKTCTFEKQSTGSDCANAQSDQGLCFSLVYFLSLAVKMLHMQGGNSRLGWKLHWAFNTVKSKANMYGFSCCSLNSNKRKSGINKTDQLTNWQI